MSNKSEIVYKECAVIGCGISGIAVSRWLKEYEIDFVVFEKSDDIAGLWRFSRENYGVMEFTHINVSKYNYCFSDQPYSEDSVEFMHNKHIYEYAKSYMDKHKLFDFVKFKHEVVLIEELKNNDDLYKKASFVSITQFDRLWKTTVRDLTNNKELIYITPFVSVATGHHGTPRYAEFPGQETFPGEIIHSVKFKSAKINKLEGKRVLLVGIGNSSVDAADNLVTEGGCPDVTISTRSGAWVFPNYLNGYSLDLYINKFFLQLPLKISNVIFENLIKFVHGNPKKYNLNPKARILQYHPTISPTLHHHIQRKKVHIKPNIKVKIVIQSINGSEVTFENGEKSHFDAIILCTGYKVDLRFLSNDLKKMVFSDEKELFLNLYKFVYQPKIGKSLSFIGYVQPHTGGILAMSEIQARWFVYLLKNKIELPTEKEMFDQIEKHRINMSKRFYESARHTLQEDPILYNDEIASFYGAKPNLIKNFNLFWRLLFSSCGPGRWRLNGLDQLPEAAEMIRKVPVPDLVKGVALIQLIVLFGILIFAYQNPIYFILLGLSLLLLTKLK